VLSNTRTSKVSSRCCTSPLQP